MATLVVPRLEAPRVAERPDLFGIEPWDETDDPIALVAELVGAARRSPSVTGRGPGSWSTSSSDARPDASWRDPEVTGPLRAVKDAAEIEALRRAAAAVDASPPSCRPGASRWSGRTEAEVSADLGRRILDEGHDRVNFAIVAAGANAASPHHEPGDRVIADGEVVLCDFGGTMRRWGVGYCSDITRCVVDRRAPAEVADTYAVLLEAQEAGVAAGRVGHAVRGRRRRRPPDHRRRRVTATSSSTAPATASASRSTRTRTSSTGNTDAARRRPRLRVEPGIYLPGPVRPPARGHRRRHRRRSRAAQPRRPPPRRRRLRASGPVLSSTPRPSCSSGPSAGCSSCGSRPGDARWASATAGCSAASTA